MLRLLMATLTFDTYDFIQSLTEAGIEEQQAKAISAGLQKMSLEHVATKHDLRNLEVSLLKDIGNLRDEMNQRHISLCRWFAASVIGQAGIIAAMLSLLR